MILEKQTETLVLSDGDEVESTNMTIDFESASFLMRMLSKFYSDSIGSCIRETASNALDSHRAAGINDPIIVDLSRQPDGNYYFTVEDFGLGLDKDDIENIIKKYGKSTKRNAANQLGAFGLGFKSPLAYSNSFYFVGRKNGMERKWMMYESDTEDNRIDLLYESPTKERNGVKVIIPVKYSDYSSFDSKMKQQLAYFENVYFLNINNNFKIVRDEDYQVSELCRDNYLHICLDNVYYPIDYAKLGISSINLPFGLRFSLSDGIFPVPNREQIKYTEEAKKIIIDKIKKVADKVVNLYNTRIEEIEKKGNLKEILAEYNATSKKIAPLVGNTWLDITQIAKYSKEKLSTVKYSKFKYLSLSSIGSLKDKCLQEYTVTHDLYYGKWKTIKDYYYSRLENHINYSPVILVYSKKLSNLMREYIKDTYPNLNGNKVVLVKKDKPFPLFQKKGDYSYNWYTSFLNLSKSKKATWREHIKEFQEMSAMFHKFEDLDSFKIPDSWIKARKDKLKESLATVEKVKKQKGEITIKVASELLKASSTSTCKFVPEIVKMEEIYKKPNFFVYTEEENDSKIQELYPSFFKTKVKFVTLSSREIKKVKDLKVHNWMNLEEFMKGKNRLFRKVATAILIHRLHDKYNYAFNQHIKVAEFSESLGQKLEKLFKYERENYKYASKDLEDAILEIAEPNNLVDLEIYPVYKDVKFILEKLVFLNKIMSLWANKYSAPDADLQRITIDLFKYYKFKLNFNHYLPDIKLEDEDISEILEEKEILDNEKIEELAV